MTRKERKLRNARLRVLTEKWERQDARNGYTVYRHSRPAYKRREKVSVGAELLFCFYLLAGAYILTVIIVG